MRVRGTKDHICDHCGYLFQNDGAWKPRRVTLKTASFKLRCELCDHCYGNFVDIGVKLMTGGDVEFRHHLARIEQVKEEKE